MCLRAGNKALNLLTLKVSQTWLSDTSLCLSGESFLLLKSHEITLNHMYNLGQSPYFNIHNYDYISKVSFVSLCNIVTGPGIWDGHLWADVVFVYRIPGSNTFQIFGLLHFHMLALIVRTSDRVNMYQLFCIFCFKAAGCFLFFFLTLAIKIMLLLALLVQYWKNIELFWVVLVQFHKWVSLPLSVRIRYRNLKL